MKDLHATIELRKIDGFWADLRIINEGEKTVSIHNPGNYRPTEGWEFSREAYNVAVLLSFHFLEMRLSRAGVPLARRETIATRAGHIVGLPVELAPSDELKVSIPLHEFYDLESGATYLLELTYGDDKLRVSAETRFQYPS
jgi:hypothetical protein